MNEIQPPHRPTSRSAPIEQAWLWIGGAILILVAMVASLVVMVIIRNDRDTPKFPLLADNPDASLVGTVAYVDTNDCVRIIALRGAPSREVYCFPKWGTGDAATLGKPLPPQLIWLENGNLEVTFFRMTIPPSSSINKGWQVIVNVETGAVSKTSDEVVPDLPNLNTRPTINALGDVLSFSSNGENGKVKITLTRKTGVKKTLLDVQGPGSYGYGLKSVFWGPDGTTIFADDGRILVIESTAVPNPRILVNGGGGTGPLDADPRGSGFAVTQDEFVHSPDL